MSDDIFEGNNISVTRFYGGEHRGVCFQFTGYQYDKNNAEWVYLQVPFHEVEEMCKATLKEIKRFKKRYPAYKKVYEHE